MRPEAKCAPAPCTVVLHACAALLAGICYHSPLPLPLSHALLPRRSNNSLQSSTMAAPLRAASPAARQLPAPALSPYAAFPAAQPAAPALPGMPYALPGVPLGYMQAPQLACPLGGIPPRSPLQHAPQLAALTSLLYSPRQPEAPAAYKPEPAAAAAAGGNQLFSMPSWGGTGGLASAASLALQPSTDLGALFGPADLPMADVEPPSKQESVTGDDWLAWDGWQVGAAWGWGGSAGAAAWQLLWGRWS